MSDERTSHNFDPKTDGKTVKANNRASSVEQDKGIYFDFFQYSPNPLWIEDFSKAKKYIDKLVLEQKTSIKSLLNSNPELLPKLSAMVVVKDVNEAALLLYKAKSKADLLGNLSNIFTEKSHEGFLYLIKAIFSGKKEAKVDSINKTLEGEEFDISLKVKVAEQDEFFENVIISCENISELVSSKKKLAISEERYKQAQSLVNMGSWSFNYENEELYISDEILKFMGIKKIPDKSEIPDFIINIHEKDRFHFTELSIKNLLKSPNQELRYRVMTPDGTWKFIYEKRHCTIINNRIVNLIGVCQNITENVEAEKHLDQTKNLFANTLSGINDALVILDENANYSYVNRKAADLLGKEVDDLLGRNIWDEFPEQKGDIFFDNYQKAKKYSEPITFENYFKPWDRWFENRIVPSNEGMMIFFQEITHRKIQESKIKEAYNIINKSASVAFLCRNDQDFPIEFVSENANSLFGYSTKEFLSGNVRLIEVIHKGDFEKITEKVLKRVRNNRFENFRPEPFRIVTKSGEEKWIRASIDFIRNKLNELTHIQGIVEDITKQKNTEELFYKSNQRLKDQFNNTPLASIMWDMDFKVIEWNNSAQRIFGYGFEEAVGRHAEELIIPPNIKIDIDKVWKSLLNQTGGYRNTNFNVTKDGRQIICDWYNVTLTDANGKVIGVASLVDDITERITSKELLEKSEKRYRDIFEQSFEAVFVLKEGLFVDCNESTLKMFGFKDKSELLSVHPSEVSPEFQSDGRNSFKKADEMMEISIEKGSNRFIWEHQRTNGQIFPAEVTLTRIDDIDGAPTIHAMVKDITERVKKELLEDVLYNISNAALTKSDFNEFCRFVQKELHKIIDTQNFFIALFDKKKNTITTPYSVGLNPLEHLPETDKILTKKVLKTKKPLFLKRDDLKTVLAKNDLADTEVLLENWLGVPLKIKNQVFGTIVVKSFLDQISYNENDVNLLEFVADQISTLIQRKKAENELKEALVKAQESDRLKSAFLANMSHEIRTPMNGIIGFSELFLKDNLTESERKKYAKIVIDSSQQLLSIVNDILDISKIEAGVVQLNYERVNINEMMDNLCSFYNPIANEKKLFLNCNRGLENYQSVITIDRIKLNQVLTNLLSNSFKFTQTGGIEFGYELKNNNLEFYVQDTGIGIDKKLRKRIFDRFTQANLELKKSNRGTGLGLSISKKFIELFNGKIWFADVANGTKVLFTIPYTKVAHNQISSVVKERTKKRKTIENRTITLLVAEDEEYNMLYINEIFNGKPYRVIEATNGEEAIEFTRKYKEIDLVLLDIKMPVLDGNEAMKIIKKERPDLPIIALSAFAMQSDQEHAIKKGFDDYLTKPIDREKLFKLINTYVN